MEALTAVSVACLTIYDMVKAVERGMRHRGHSPDRERAAANRATIAPRIAEAQIGDSNRGIDAGREALALVLRDASPLGAEAAPLAQAHGRVLADDLMALRTQPPADVSAMDGYAVRAADVAEAPASLKVIGEVSAGAPSPAWSAAARRRASSPAESCRAARYGRYPGTQRLARMGCGGGKATAKGRNVRPQGLDFAAARCCSVAGRRSVIAIWRWLPR